LVQRTCETPVTKIHWWQELVEPREYCLGKDT
jgi:hypothetical protein